jgi:predicted Ser/Thr protein kinase
MQASSARLSSKLGCIMQMLLAVGAKLGPYEILARIGAGGMGEVYRAMDTKLDREVAIKVLPDAWAQDPERVARFHREAKVLASLNHPNIAQIYGVEDRALVMELVGGETLGSLLKRGALPIETSLDYARQIAEALETAHEKGIVHRDLKPSNVMVTPAGLVKVLDFGLAKMVDGPSTRDDPQDSPTVTLSPTRAGIILGTAAYMSPEQARGGIADKRADIWTFGVVLYEMLTAKRAFSGESVSDILAGVLRADLDWSALPAATPLRIRALLRRCLERDRTKRLQAIGEARIAIDGTDAPERDAMPPSRGDHRWPWAVAALTTAVTVIAAIGLSRAGHTDPLHPLMRLDVELGQETSLAKLTDGPILALSPDGTTLAMIVRDANGETRLATRPIGQSQVTLLAGTEGATAPFFSLDGQWIGFHADRKIKKISAAGGAAVTLCDASANMTGSWGDDGNIIATLGWGASLSRIPSAGGAPSPVTLLERGEFRHSWPQVLPGSRKILFTTEFVGQSIDEADTEVFSLDTGKRTLLHHRGFFGRYLPSGHLVWIFHNVMYAASFDLDRLKLTGQPQPVLEDVDSRRDEGGQFAFSQTGNFAYVSMKGELQRSIFWLDRAGKTQPLHAAPGLYSAPRFSPDGKHLAFSVSDDQSREDIWVQDLERDTASRASLLPGRNQSPVWTPDGKNLIFWSSNPAAQGIYSIRADGSGVPQRLTDGATEQAQISISPDGKRLAVAQVGVNGGVEIWTVPLEGDIGRSPVGVVRRQPEPFVQTPFITILPTFSPDGHFLAYSSFVPGKKGLWVVPFPGPGGGWLVSATGDSAIWPQGADGAGREVYFMDLESQTIMVSRYTAAGDALVFDKPRVWSPHRVLDLGSPPMRAFDVAPDGKRVAVVLNVDGTADPKPITHLTFLVNFSDELRRRAPVLRK